MILPTENQVCDLKYAKLLKELGIKQESLWAWWRVIQDTEKWVVTLKKQMPLIYQEKGKIYFDDKADFRCYSAFTVAELLKIYNKTITIPAISTNVANFVAQEIINEIQKSKRLW